MEFINSKRFWILNSLILGFVILQILDFPTFGFPWIIDIAKFAIFISVIFFALRNNVQLKKKLIVLIVYLFLIFCSYLVPFSKVTTNIWLSNIEQEFSQVVDIVNNDDSFSFIIYDKSGDSLKTNPISLKERYTNEELNTIKTFLKKNYYLELWNDEYGIVMVYRRFLDNSAGFILCQEKQCREAMDTANYNNKDYYQLNENWYQYYSR